MANDGYTVHINRGLDFLYESGCLVTPTIAFSSYFGRDFAACNHPFGIETHPLVENWKISNNWYLQRWGMSPVNSTPYLFQISKGETAPVDCHCWYVRTLLRPVHQPLAADICTICRFLVAYTIRLDGSCRYFPCHPLLFLMNPP